MATSTALDSKVNFKMWLDSMGSRMTKFLASSLSDEEKLAAITGEMRKDVQAKRVLARQIRAQMCAIKDPDTAALEPLEAAQMRREKLVKLGAASLDNHAKLGQIQQEVRSVDALIASQQGTYDTLESSCKVAMDNYRMALAALESAEQNGPAMLKAIRAHKDALAMKDKAKNQKTIDASFISDLASELSAAQAELKSDDEIDHDLDGTNGSSINADLAKMDAASVSEDLMAEFRAAAGKTKDASAAAAVSAFKVTVEPSK